MDAAQNTEVPVLNGWVVQQVKDIVIKPSYIKKDKEKTKD